MTRHARGAEHGNDMQSLATARMTGDVTLAPLPVAFVSPIASPCTHLHNLRTPVCPRSRHAKSGPKMIDIDPDAVGTGYALLNSLKGVVIGPTVNEMMSAICGGTVGVMGTIITLEVRRQRVKERKQCPYCRGTGKLPCATCYSVGTIPSASAVTAHESCNLCMSSGYLDCNHCEGDGRLIPWVFERAVRSQYEDYVYTPVDDYYQDRPPYI